MNSEARLSVQSALDLLAARMNPILTQELAPVLSGLPWTTVLEQLDRMKGFVPKTYLATDVQAQLRMVTERLGSLGYPFDTGGSRVVSTLGNELRIIRNRWAHDPEFTSLDAWRTWDFVCRLLEHFGDDKGLATAWHERTAALMAAVSEEGLTREAVEESASTIVEAQPHEQHETEELVIPASETLVRSDAKPTDILGAGRAQFEPWVPVLVGDVSVLDDLPRKAAKGKVRAVAVEIVEFEGPIHIERLSQLMAESFGLHRLHATRERKIAYQIRQTGLIVDDDKFVWPSTIDRETWSEFRPNDSTVDRPFIWISPVEVGNAAKFLMSRSPDLGREELESAILQTFGRKRRTQQCLEHIERALSSMA